jgi:protein involved in temperature-dependent protein secretion
MITVQELVARVTAETTQFRSEMAGVEGTTSKVAKAGTIAGLALAAGLAVGIYKAVEAGQELQVSEARLTAAFAAAHLKASDYEEGIKGAETAARKLGFTNKDVRDSLGSLVAATGDGAAALRDMNTVEDLARFKHIGLADASKIVTSAMAGSARAARQLGIVVLPLHDHVQALKDAHTDLTTQLGRAELATATLADKQATAAKVIDTVSQHVKGQADAFAATSSGSMAQFHAQLGAITEDLGKSLLPAITAVTNVLAILAGFFAEHQGLVKVLVIGLGLLSAALLVSAAATWAMNSALLANPLTWIILAVAAFAVGIVYAYEKIKVFREVVTAGLDAVKLAIGLVVDIITGNWVGAWKKIAGAPQAALLAVLDAIGAAEAFIVAKAIALGKGIADGIIHGVEGLPGVLGNALKDAIKGALDGVMGFFGIHSPSTYTADTIGKPLASGVAAGMTAGQQQIFDATGGWTQAMADGIAKGGHVVFDATGKLVLIVAKDYTTFAQKYWKDAANQAASSLTPDNAKLESVAQQFGLQVHTKFLDSMIAANEALAADMKSTNPKFLHDYVTYAIDQMNLALKQHNKAHADAWRALANDALKAYTDKIQGIKDAAAKAAKDATAAVSATAKVTTIYQPLNGTANQGSTTGFGGVGGSQPPGGWFPPNLTPAAPTVVQVNNPTFLSGNREELRRFADTLTEFLP